MLKQCTKCNKFKELSEFWKNSCTKNGIYPSCIECGRKYRKEYYQKNRDSIKNKTKQYTIDNREKVNAARRDYVKRNKYKRYIISKKYWENNREFYYERGRAWRAANNGRCKYLNSKYRAKKKGAILNGFDDQIKEIYKNCPKGYEVDHIVPIQNKLVCGLHVPWNLQYLTKSENKKKSNKFYA